MERAAISVEAVMLWAWRVAISDCGGDVGYTGIRRSGSMGEDVGLTRARQGDSWNKESGVGCWVLLESSMLLILFVKTARNV